jgi:predicted amidohydrolase
MKTALSLALYQCAPGPLDVAGNLQRLDLAAQNASQGGADVLVCPEMFLTGYNIGRDAVSRLAQTADGAYAQAVADIAQRHTVAIVYGYPERGETGAVFNAAQWINALGERCLNYRKTHLFGNLDHAQFAAGEASSGSVELKGWQVSLLICYDVEFPENTRRLALAGADLIVVPTANMSGFDFVSTAVVPVRAYENQVYVAYANYTGQEDAIQYGGLSTVAAPDGAIVAHASRDETLIFTALDSDRLDAARRHCTHVADLKAMP